MLIVTAGPEKGRSFTLGPDDVVLGRAEDAAFHLASSSVGRHHARVHAEAGHVVVEDLGSANGTWVNGARVEGPTVLQPGDELRVADVPMRCGLVTSIPTQRRQDSDRASYTVGDEPGPGNRRDAPQDHEPPGEQPQGRGVARVLLAVGSLVALVGFALCMPVIAAGSGGGLALALGLAMFLGGGLMAGVGFGMSRAAPDHERS
jgi:hypothetical protein